MATLCLLHPGAMGVSIGSAAAAGGHDVRWVSTGRSPATRGRAEAAGFVDTPSLDEAVDGAAFVVSVCPPDQAGAVAMEVAATGFSGIFLDANAVAPATTRAVAETVEAAGATAVDGGIVGPPAHRSGTTRVFLSGTEAAQVAALFEGSLLDTVVIDGGVGAASATKVAYAAWTKGSSALLLAVAAYAEAEGVTGPLLEEWARSQPGLEDRLNLTAGGVAPKAWRFAGELTDSGHAFAAVGLPSGFGSAAAEIYARLEHFRDHQGVDLESVVRRLGAAALDG